MEPLDFSSRQIGEIHYMQARMTNPHNDAINQTMIQAGAANLPYMQQSNNLVNSLLQENILTTSSQSLSLSHLTQRFNSNIVKNEESDSNSVRLATSGHYTLSNPTNTTTSSWMSQQLQQQPHQLQHHHVPHLPQHHSNNNSNEASNSSTEHSTPKRMSAQQLRLQRESPDERERRLSAGRERMRLHRERERMTESQVEKDKRLAIARERTRLGRLQESPNQREKRLKKTRDRLRMKRQLESTDEREERLKNHRESKRERYHQMSPEQRSAQRKVGRDPSDTSRSRNREDQWNGSGIGVDYGVHVKIESEDCSSDSRPPSSSSDPSVASVTSTTNSPAAVSSAMLHTVNPPSSHHTPQFIAGGVDVSSLAAGVGNHLYSKAATHLLGTAASCAEPLLYSTLTNVITQQQQQHLQQHQLQQQQQQHLSVTGDIMQRSLRSHLPKYPLDLLQTPSSALNAAANESIRSSSLSSLQNKKDSVVGASSYTDAELLIQAADQYLSSSTDRVQYAPAFPFATNASQHHIAMSQAISSGVQSNSIDTTNNGQPSSILPNRHVQYNPSFPSLSTQPTSMGQ